VPDLGNCVFKDSFQHLGIHEDKHELCPFGPLRKRWTFCISDKREQSFLNKTQHSVTVVYEEQADDLILIPSFACFPCTVPRNLTSI